MPFKVNVFISGLNAFAFKEVNEIETLFALVVNNRDEHKVCPSNKEVPPHFPYLTIKYHQADKCTKKTLEEKAIYPMPEPDGELIAQIPIKPTTNQRARDISIGNLPKSNCRRSRSLGERAFKRIPTMKEIDENLKFDWNLVNKDEIEENPVLARLQLYGGRAYSDALELSQSTGRPQKMAFYKMTQNEPQKMHDQSMVAKRVLFSTSISDRKSEITIDGVIDGETLALSPRWKGDIVQMAFSNLPRMDMSAGYHFARYLDLCESPPTNYCIVPQPSKGKADHAGGTDSAGNAFCPLVQFP